MGRNRRTGNHETSSTSSSHAESSWRLAELTEGLVRIAMGSLFPYSTIGNEKDDFLRRRRLRALQNFERMTSQARQYWRNKKQAGVQILSPENTSYTAMMSPWRRRLCKECKPSRRSRSSYGSRQKPISNLVAKRWICSKQTD